MDQYVTTHISYLFTFITYFNTYYLTCMIDKLLHNHDVKQKLLILSMYLLYYKFIKFVTLMVPKL